MSAEAEGGSGKKSAPIGEGGPSRFRAAWLKFKHVLLNVEQTEFHSDFVQMIEDAKELARLNKLLIKAMKTFAQPNPTYQPGLFYVAGVENEYEQLSRVLIEVGLAVKSKSSKSAEFYKKLAKVISDCNSANTAFLKQILSNVIKPLERYVDNDLTHILAENRKLMNCKAQYDDAKNQLRLCKPERIDEVNALLKTNKTAFENQANYVTDLLNKLPDYLEEQRKAVRVFANALRIKHESSGTAIFKLLQETVADTAPIPPKDQ